MIRTLFQFLYGSVPAEFKSGFDLVESINRLRAATKRSVFSALAQTAAVGPVKETKVRLQRVIPLVGNSFKPFFFGRFEVRQDGVYLVGKFTLLPFVKVFMTFWLGATTFIGFLLLAAGGQAQGAGRWAALGPFVMVGFGIGLVAVGKWFARNDVDWLSNVIRTALKVPTPTPLGGAGPLGAIERETPMVLRVTAGVLLLGGVLNLINAYGDLVPTGLANSQLRQPLLLDAFAILGVVMIGLAIGVYQRKLPAWRLGLLFLAATAVLSFAQMLWFAPFPEPVGVKVAISVGVLVVYAIWTRWWYAQRVHFIQEGL